MSIKLSGSISRKIPIDSIPYSSQSFSAGMELEVSDPATIQAQLAQLYTTLSRGIDAQIAATTRPAAPVQHSGNGNGQVQTPPPPAPQPVPQRNGYASRNRVANVAANGNGNGRSVTATAAQQRAIFAIAKSLNLDLPSLLADYNCSEVAQLHIRDASKLIDDLKSRQVPQA